MNTIIQQLALVSESKLVGIGDVMRVAAALQKQASRDLAPIWGISATVDAFEKLEDVPIGYWPMIVKDDIGFSGAAGIHLDKDRQPFALITSSSDLDLWSLTASHESLEMLVDPFGAEYAYTCNGILVSDFYTPNFFDPVASPSVRYSFTGAIKEPRDVLHGGYLSWVDSTTGHWWQEIWFGGAESQFRDIGPLDATAGSLRSQIDRITTAETMKALSAGRTAASAAGLTSATAKRSTTSAAMWRTKIDAIVGQAKPPAAPTTPGRRRARRIGD
jgi:hypothetical protein